MKTSKEILREIHALFADAATTQDFRSLPETVAAYVERIRRASVETDAPPCAGIPVTNSFFRMIGRVPVQTVDGRIIPGRVDSIVGNNPLFRREEIKVTLPDGDTVLAVRNLETHDKFYLLKAESHFELEWAR